MTQDPIAPVVAFHEQLARLSAAGLPFDLGTEVNGSPSSRTGIRNAINRVETALRLRVELGQPLQDAIGAASELTLRHRTSLLTWLETEDVSSAFESLTQTVQYRVQAGRRVSVSMIQPFVLALLTSLAFIILCATTIPKLEAIYTQLGKPPSGALTCLIILQKTMPVWGVLIPVLIGVIWLCFLRASTMGRSRWFIGGSRYLESMRLAQFADQVAAFVDRGIPRDRAFSMADSKIASQALTNPLTLPPLLRWAMSGNFGNEPVPAIFRFVANSYREIADQHATGWQVFVSKLSLSLFGGLLVFGFGLSLFVPVIDLLFELSSPGGT